MACSANFPELKCIPVIKFIYVCCCKSSNNLYSTFLNKEVILSKILLCPLLKYPKCCVVLVIHDFCRILTMAC
jgi:hypothetical protein